ncbi:MAG: SCO family protein [Erythrobacter sp.]|uniref:SCO family protein n=1 Tax=Erythrobacter sp. TaxID=1042 RepID=UPI00262335C1|nr:SCO family protein [Erythrobacter sp.]MDJ0978993.1 SCO family protein [Erythrobacter sp.]
MNTRAKPPIHAVLRSALLVTLGSAGLAACAPGAGTPGPAPLAGADIGGAFTLTSSTGKTVAWDDFRGSYAVVYFGYAYCPDVCPTDMQRTAQGLRILKERNPALASRTQAVFISIDPERDTPEVVGEFVSAFSDDLVGLTGSPEAVKAAADAFRVYYKKGEETPNGGYLVDHTNIVYLFDPDGEPLAMLPTNEGSEAVADEIEKWAS